MAPDPWLTFWIACGGLAASFASGFAALWALTQKHRYLPKPLMIGKTVITDSGAAEYGASRTIRVVVENLGNGTAHDVQLYLCSVGRVERKVEHQPKREHGEALRYSALLKDGPDIEDLYGDPVEISGTDPLVPVWARVTWRQAPRMDKMRTLTLHPTS